MSIGTYALATLNEILRYLDKDPTREALSVYYDGANATATVEVEDKKVICTDGSAHEFDLDDGSYNTLQGLVNAINAIADWTATLIWDEDADSDNLIITASVSCKDSGSEQTLFLQETLSTQKIYFLERLIDRATDFIERYCQRLLVSRTYNNEQYFGSGESRLLLEQYPVTRVIRIQVSRANSFSILNSSTDANFCSVEITATVIRLIVDGGANADDTSLTLADYASIDALITAIHALAKGWVCTTLATDTATRDAGELLIRPSMFVGIVTSAYCETGDDSLTEYMLIAPAEARNYGIVERAGTFVKSTEYHISYTAGYTTIPDALEMACIELVKYKYEESQKGAGLKSEQIGKVYSYEKFGLEDLKYGLSPDLVAELDLFRRREF